jgi:thymidine kinase
VVIGDTGPTVLDVRYQVLCRRHHRSGDLGPRDSGPPIDETGGTTVGTVD